MIQNCYEQSGEAMQQYYHVASIMTEHELRLGYMLSRC